MAYLFKIPFLSIPREVCLRRTGCQTVCQFKPRANVYQNEPPHTFVLAQRNAYAAQQDYVNAQYDYILSALRLKAQAGQLNEQDLIDFNQWLK